MGFAEPHAGVDIKRIEHHRVAAPPFGHLARRRMRQRVGAADDEACKGQPRIERRAAERIVAGGHRRDRGCAQFGHGTAIGSLGATRIERRGRLLYRCRATHRRAHRQVDPMHFRHLRLPAREHALGIMGLNPTLEKPRRDRQANAFILHALQVHSREPACIDILSHACAQPTLHA